MTISTTTVVSEIVIKLTPAEAQKIKIALESTGNQSPESIELASKLAV